MTTNRNRWNNYIDNPYLYYYLAYRFMNTLLAIDLLSLDEYAATTTMIAMAKMECDELG